MQRTTREPAAAKPDYSPLIRALMYLDETLKRGVVIGIYEGSMEVSDEDVKKALINVNAILLNTREELEKTSRLIARLQAPSSTILQ